MPRAAAVLVPLTADHPSIRAVVERLLGTPLRPSAVTRGVYMLFPKRVPEHECGAPGLSPHTDTTCAMLSGTVLLADAAPGTGNTTLWPGSHRRLHPLWTTCFGSAKSAAQAAATPLAMQEIVASTTPVELCGRCTVHDCARASNLRFTVRVDPESGSTLRLS